MICGENILLKQSSTNLFAGTSLGGTCGKQQAWQKELPYVGTHDKMGDIVVVMYYSLRVEGKLVMKHEMIRRS